MKNLRFIFMITLIFVMLSSVCMAAGIVDFDTTVTELDTDNSIIVKIVPTAAIDAEDGSSFEVVYNAADWAVTDITRNYGYQGTESDGKLTMSTLSTVTLDTDTPFVTFKATLEGTTPSKFDVVALTLIGSDGTFEFNDANTVSATFTPVKATAQEEVVDATVVDEDANAVVYGAENSYWGAWVGTYKVALNGKTLQSAVVTFEGVDGKSFPTENTNWAEGEGEATFKIAIIGVPDEYADKSVAKATLK